MIVLELTSVHNKGMRVFIASPAVHVTDNSGKTPDQYDRQRRVGCTVADGIHNNGGFHVQESYDDVVDMIRSQLMRQGFGE